MNDFPIPHSEGKFIPSTSYVKAAVTKKAADETLAINNDAAVDRVDDGAWVQAWVFVTNEEATSTPS